MRILSWAEHRGWRNARLLSDIGNEFARDIGAEDNDGDPVETVAVFKNDEGTIRNTYIGHAYVLEEIRGIGLLSPVWHLFDLLPSGRDDWNPKNDYSVV